MPREDEVDFALHYGDCLEVMKQIPDGSVDMVLTDPPYGTTACKWDSVIPLEPMWKELKRVTKKGDAIVMTASQPFTTLLIHSNLSSFKYEYTWLKTRKSGNFNAKKRPLVGHENILVFYDGRCKYEPYTDVDNPLSGKGTPPTSAEVYSGCRNQDTYVRPPRMTRDTVIKGFDVGKDRGLHPTQKPVPLMEYLIKTYTNEGDTVLDFTMGSGTTGVAALNLGRRFIGIEKDATYFEVAKSRIHESCFQTV